MPMRTYADLLKLAAAFPPIPRPSAADLARAAEAIDDPHRLARINLEAYRAGGRNLVKYSGEWLAWKRGCYRPIEDSDLKDKLAGSIKAELDRAFGAGEVDRENVPRVTPHLVSSVVQATASMVILPSSTSHPAWIGDEAPWPAAEAIATTSGILHLPSAVAGRPCFVPPTPDFFSRNCLPYGFDEDARCPLWESTLEQFWPGDSESVETLQEWFGYCLTPDTSQHKLCMLIGPPRCGKGTIGRVLRAVIGEQNMASPTLASLSHPFGLQPLVGKLVALVADARLSSRTDGIVVVERLLSISGEDPQDVARKNKTTLTGTHLPTRFVIMSNELPNMHDVSGALMTRVILLRLTRSYAGMEDRRLFDKLQRELPGILNWAIHGWRRLQERGYLRQPETGQGLIDDFQDIASPIKAFVRDKCILGPEFEISVDDIFRLWEGWCRESGRDNTLKKQLFARDLISAFPMLRKKFARIGHDRERRYVGIGERESFFRPTPDSEISRQEKKSQRDAF